jgi:hypothetical protein
VVGEDVTKEVFGDYVKWKGVMRMLFSGQVDSRRGDEKFLIWLGLSHLHKDLRTHQRHQTGEPAISSSQTFCGN